MAEEVIPEDIRRFLLEYIDSIAQWEGLLLLHSESGRLWSSGMLAHDLYIPEADASQVLVQLSARGFLSAGEDGFRYHPQSPELDAALKRAAEFYARCLVPVTHFIHSKSKSRIQEFADAFRIKKE